MPSAPIFGSDPARPLVQVVDDDKVVCRILEMGCRAIRADTIVAGTLAEARSQLATHPIDVTIMDGWLPDGNGLDLILWIRTSVHLKDLPIVFCTADPARGLAAEGLAQGIDAVLIKPVDVGSVSEHVTRALRRAPQRWEPDHAVAERLGLSRKEYRSLTELVVKELRTLLNEIEASLAGQATQEDLKTLFFRTKSAALTIGAMRLVRTLELVPSDDLNRDDLVLIADVLRADIDPSFGRFAQKSRSRAFGWAG